MERVAERMGGTTKWPYNDSDCLDAVSWHFIFIDSLGFIGMISVKLQIFKMFSNAHKHIDYINCILA